MKEHPSIMAEPREVVERSFNINKKLGPRLIAAAEQNAILRIGWTNAGEPVPKNGELGLCPNLPTGSRIRALGLLGSWTAAFGSGGNFTIQGDAKSFLGAGNRGNSIYCEQLAEQYTGYAMHDGRIVVMDGTGDDAGAMMCGGLLMIRGVTGARIGGGMKGGLIVVHGDVGSDPGAGMTGGRIVINGRCPTPPVGVSLRPLESKEVKEINSLLNNKDMEIPSDAVCLVAAPAPLVEPIEPPVSASDLSNIGLVPGELHQTNHYQTCDTISLLAERNGENTPVALPLPLLPMIPDGDLLKSSEDMDAHAASILANQPFITRLNPRPNDMVIIDRDNLNNAPELLEQGNGVILDMDSLPAMNSEEIDGFLVAIQTLQGRDKTVAFLNALGRVESLHVRSSHHNIDLAISRVEDGSGVAEAAALPMIGRSSKAHLEDAPTQTGVLLGLSASGKDLAVLRASGMHVVCCEVPMQDVNDLAHWLQSISNEFIEILKRLGLDSIDQLQRQHLRALDYETAAISGLRLVGYDRPLPLWFAR